MHTEYVESKGLEVSKKQEDAEAEKDYTQMVALQQNGMTTSIAKNWVRSGQPIPQGYLMNFYIAATLLEKLLRENDKPVPAYLKKIVSSTGVSELDVSIAELSERFADFPPTLFNMEH